jgi:hypothetical protein
MKKFYSIVFLFSFFLLAGCSKDFLKSYEDRIIGTWRIADVSRVDLWGSSTDNLSFRQGSFNFMKDGTMTFTDANGSIYKGTWDIRQKTVNNSDGDQTIYQSLQITAVNFATQQVLGEYYDDINFVGTNHIKAWIYSGSRTYLTHLRR